MKKELQNSVSKQMRALQHPLNHFQWIYPEKNEQIQQKIIEEFQIHPVIAQILISRGFLDLSAIHHFLYAKLPNLHDPDLIDDMDVAVKRVISALEKRENILIYGDNDVDGMSAAALLTEFLREMGSNVFFDVPNRISLKKSVIGNALEMAKKHHCSLLITVDCGITAAKEIQELASNGIDVIVTDHHEPTSKIPHCIATLNPKLINSTYPNRDLTGVGVAFKLAHAVTNAMIDQGKISPSEIDLKKYLDLVALGTIADTGPLKGENRILVRYGLKKMSKMDRTGLAQLFAKSELEHGKRSQNDLKDQEGINNPPQPFHSPRKTLAKMDGKIVDDDSEKTRTQPKNEPIDDFEITPNDIASKIAPRLNSLGRISDPIKGVELLLLRDKTEAEKLCIELDLNNLKRQKIEREAALDIEGMLFQFPEILNSKAIVLQSEKWHPGIVAILAARVVKQTNRPTLILSLEQGIGKGSLRTTPEFPLMEVLKENQDLLINFGGHDFAAGLTISEKNIPLFKERFLSAAEIILKDQNTYPKIYLDSKVSFEDLTFDFIESLNLLEPFGNENPHPVLYSDVIQTWPPKAVGKNHLKLFFEQNGRQLEGVAFGMADRRKELRGKNVRLRIAFTPHVNHFLSKASIQLQIKDFQIK